MSYASSLLDDVLTFLCFLRSSDVAPVYKRFLPPRAVTAVCPLLHDVTDLSEPPHPRSERKVDRLRFVHYVCECAGLVAPTGSFLKPTPAAAQWIALPPVERARRLVHQALTANTQQVRTLWRAYHLPCWQATDYHTPISLLLNALLASPSRFVPHRRLAAVLPLSFTQDIEPASLAPELEQLLRYLAWFNMLTIRGRSSVRLSAWARMLLDADAGPTELASSQRTHPAGALRVTSTCTVVAPANTDGSVLFELSQYAALVATFPQHRYRLEHSLVHRAIQSGSTLSQVVSFLESVTRSALPTPVMNTLHKWADDIGHVTVSQAIILETDTAERLTALVVDKRLHPSIQRLLAPRIAEVHADRVAALVAQLKRRGLTPQVRLQLTPPAEGEQIPRQSLKRFDQPTLAHLYVSARLCHALADVIPGRARPPYSVVLDVEAQLSPHDRAVAEQLVDDCVQAWQSHQSGAISHADLPAPAARHLALLEQAIETGATLLMNYYTPTRGEAAWRKIDPIQVDGRNGIVYLLAYCHLSQAERTFRVDRILDLQPISGPISGPVPGPVPGSVPGPIQPIT